MMPCDQPVHLPSVLSKSSSELAWSPTIVPFDLEMRRLVIAGLSGRREVARVIRLIDS